MIITSRQNVIVKEFRDCGGELFAVEGAKLISDALDAGLVLQSALFTEKAAQKHGALFERIGAVSVINPDISEYISDTKTPQGVFALFRRPVNAPDFSACARLILLDGVRDPGNAGAIARSCEAFGFDGIILSGNSADLFGKKTVRASAGSAFRLPSYRAGSLDGIIDTLKNDGFTVYAADLDGTPVNKTVFAEKSAFVIGSEGEGISRETVRLCDGKIYIPIKGTESLNAAVAAGILCYAAGDTTIDN